jgi:hypothetical protein
VRRRASNFRSVSSPAVLAYESSAYVHSLQVDNSLDDGGFASFYDGWDSNDMISASVAGCSEFVKWCGELALHPRLNPHFR